MTPPTKPRVKVPDTIKAGEVIEVKTLISHPMETGQRKGADGDVIPRSIVNALVARFEGTEVFRADLHPAISANPYVAFYMKVPRSGDLEVVWVDDASSKVVEKVRLEVTT